MDMAWRVLPRRRKRREREGKFHFPQNRYSSRANGFQVVWGFMHPSLEMQRALAAG
jgi:hypothetical protein